MAEEKEPRAKKAKKTVVPDAPKGAKESLPTGHEIREARKAQLVAWSETFGLETEGKVDELRKRLLEFIAAEAEKAAPPEKGPPPKEEPAKKPEKKLPAKPKEKKGPKREKEEKEEPEAAHEPRQKPKLDPRLEKLLALRAAKGAQRPKFRRQEWFRYKKFGEAWRKPQGGQSKLRRHFGYRWNLPSVGYRGPREVRGFHPSGFQEVLVHNPAQLDGLDPEKQAVRIAHGVGSRKREMIERACDDKGIRVLNRMVTE